MCPNDHNLQATAASKYISKYWKVPCTWLLLVSAFVSSVFLNSKVKRLVLITGKIKMVPCFSFNSFVLWCVLWMTVLLESPTSTALVFWLWTVNFDLKCLTDFLMSSLFYTFKDAFSEADSQHWRPAPCFTADGLFFELYYNFFFFFLGPGSILMYCFLNYVIYFFRIHTVCTVISRSIMIADE